jgi:competence protein ComFC
VDLDSLFSSLKQKALNFLFPPRCVSCGKGGTFFCRKCHNKLIYLQAPLCIRCSKPIRTGTICNNCQSRNWDIDGIYSVFKYGGAIRHAIIQFKYENIKVLADPLSHFMLEYLKEHHLSFDIIIPVPIHKRRLRERGYNQSLLLAKKLSHMTRLPVVEGSLLRTKNTPHQASSDSVEQRRENIRNAFKCVNHDISGKRILLIDDVCTSGATLNSCATSLKSAGAASVWGFTLAKEI